MGFWSKLFCGSEPYPQGHDPVDPPPRRDRATGKAVYLGDDACGAITSHGLGYLCQLEVGHEGTDHWNSHCGYDSQWPFS